MAQANLFFLLALFGNYLLANIGLPRGITGTVATHIAIFGILPVILAAKGSLSFRRTFRLRAVPPRTLIMAVLATLVAWGIAQAVAMLTSATLTLLGGQLPEYYEPLMTAEHAPWLLMLLIAVIPAFFEELSFRGFLLSGYSRLGAKAAWIGTGLLFAAMHGSLIRLPTLAVLGMVFSYVSLRTGSIIPSMFMHLVNNAIALGLALATNTAANTQPVAQGNLFWTSALAVAIAVGLLPPLVAILRRLPTPQLSEPASPPVPAAAPPRPDKAWWPLVPAGLVLLVLFWSELAGVWG